MFQFFVYVKTGKSLRMHEPITAVERKAFFEGKAIKGQLLYTETVLNVFETLELAMIRFKLM